MYTFHIFFLFSAHEKEESARGPSYMTMWRDHISFILINCSNWKQQKSLKSIQQAYVQESMPKTLSRSTKKYVRTGN